MRSVMANRLRLGLTSLAIMLAVGFISGTYIFTDSLHAALTNLVTARQADVVVSPKSEFGRQFNDSLAVQTLPQDLAAKIRPLPGVAVVASWVQVRNVAVLGSDGRPIGGDQGPGSSGQGQSWIDDPELAVVTIDAGTKPSGSSQVAIDATTAGRTNLKIGDVVAVALPSGRVIHPTITALVNRGLGGGSSGAASLAIFDVATAQDLLLAPGRVTQFRILDEPGVSQETVASEVRSVAPDSKVQTGQQIADTTAQNLAEGLGFLNTVLLIFAMIALFVATFLIFNTFSMLVAQRTRELALLRAIGATSGQVTRSVLLEALVVAIVAATIGIGLGVGVCLGLREVFAMMGDPLPDSGVLLTGRTVWVSYAVGVLVTLVSAWVPARRAAAVSPVAALRDDVALSHRSLRLRTWTGLILLLFAIAAALAGARGAAQPGASADRAASLVGSSALLALVGLLLLAPILARAVLPWLAAPVRNWTTGRLARENATRNPRRTAATASALMIGLTLMTAISVLAASVVASTDAVVDRVVGADFVVLGDGYRPFPNAVYTALAGTPGASTVTFVRSVPVRTPSAPDGTLVVGVDPALVSSVLTFDMTAGSLKELTNGTVLLDTKSARDQGLELGSTVVMNTVAGAKTVRIVGLYEPSGFYQGYVATLGEVDAMGAPPLDTAVYIKVAPGADQQAVRADLDRRLKNFPTVQLADQTQFKRQIADQVAQLLKFILALLILAVIIAILGIVNTLTLSVLERSREIGLLRALGALRGQIRRMVLIESVLIAVFGALLGLLLGIGYGTLLQRALATQGIDQLGVSWGQLGWFLALAVVGGILAALWPAWRASRLNILQAISTD